MKVKTKSEASRDGRAAEWRFSEKKQPKKKNKNGNKGKEKEKGETRGGSLNCEKKTHTTEGKREIYSRGGINETSRERTHAYQDGFYYRWGGKKRMDSA